MTLYHLLPIPSLPSDISACQLPCPAKPASAGMRACKTHMHFFARGEKWVERAEKDLSFSPRYTIPLSIVPLQAALQGFLVSVHVRCEGGQHP